MSLNLSQEIPTMLRILPMSKSNEWEYWNISKIHKEFLLKKLAIERNGKYHYKYAGMKAEQGSVILFQFDNQIIGLAELIDIKKSDDPEYFDNITELNNDSDYKGAYYFEPHSIRTFEPIKKEEMINIWNNEFIGRDGKKHPPFERFNQTKQFLDPEKYPNFCSLLKNIKKPK